MLAMKSSKLYWSLMGMLCLMLGSVDIAAPADWRIGQAQDRLKAAGFDPGPLDGVLGQRTREALRRYQASQGLPATGQLDEATRQALMRRDLRQTAREVTPESWLKAPPGGDFKKLSSLAQLPDYFPGLGTLYVDPTTLPAGPFLAYDHQGNLVSSVYMIPLKDLRAGQAFNTLAAATAKTDHVDIYYNNGHAGVPEPHYHIVLWYVSPKEAAALQ
jgi:peptidoglycan hydrolase-like protein with peptidoglycan-binding domain